MLICHENQPTNSVKVKIDKTQRIASVGYVVMETKRLIP